MNIIYYKGISRTYRFIAIAMLIMTCNHANATSQSLGEKKAMLDNLIDEFYSINLMDIEYPETIEIQKLCKKIYDLSNQIKDPYYQIMANTNYGRYLNSIGEYKDAYRYLVTANELYNQYASELDHSTIELSSICLIWNNLAIYYINCNLDYPKAQEYLMKGMEFAKTHSLTKEYAILSYNLTLLNYIRQDGSGLQFTLETYNQGVEWNDEYIMFTGALSLGIIYYVIGDYDLALKYIEQSINSPEIQTNNVMAYATYANILNVTGNIKEAQKYYDISLKQAEREPITIAVYAYLSYGKFLLENNQPKEAIEILDKAIHYDGAGNFNVFLYQVYECISQAYNKIGNSEKALEFSQKYHYEYTKIFDIKNERKLSELTLKYNSALHKAEINEYDIKVMEKDRLLLIFIFIFIIILSVAVFLGITYWNNNKLYTKIVKQYKAATDKQKELEKTIYDQKQIIKEYIPEDKDRTQPISVDVYGELFLRLENLMKVEKVYKEHTLTQEKLAERLGTNRTYLARIINDNTSKTFQQYLNSYRVEEAVTMLSNLDNDYPLKAVCNDSGFASRTTFYKFFKEQVGMTPAKYIERIRSIS